MRKLKIHIHCSATRSDNISASTIRDAIATYWSDVGYHYIINSAIEFGGII